MDWEVTMGDPGSMIELSLALKLHSALIDTLEGLDEDGECYLDDLRVRQLADGISVFIDLISNNLIKPHVPEGSYYDFRLILIAHIIGEDADFLNDVIVNLKRALKKLRKNETESEGGS